MNKIIVTARLMKNNDIDVKAFKDKDEAIEDIMQTLYGEDWDIQMNDDKWELSEDIRFAFDNLDEYGWYAPNNKEIVVVREVDVD